MPRTTGQGYALTFLIMSYNIDPEHEKAIDDAFDKKFKAAKKKREREASIQKIVEKRKKFRAYY